ncbi:MAG: ImmA/IrrE family metallo-endopeptidase [Coriobacteriia bacterium]
MTNATRRAMARAAEERRRLGLGSEPILGLRELIESEGLLVYETSIEGGSLSGCFAVIGEDNWIMVNTAHSVGRQRFTLAHEYCHYLVDRNLRFVVCTDDKPAHEIYADAFAAGFLMPLESLDSFFAGEIAATGSLKAERVVEYCYAYGVSFSAAVNRLSNAGFLSSVQRNSLLALKPTVLARDLGYDISHPSSPFFRSAKDSTNMSESLPRLYRAAAFQAYSKKQISESKLANLLGIDEDDLEDILEIGNTDEYPFV